MTYRSATEGSDGLRAGIGLMGQDLMRNVYVIIGSAIVALLPGSVKYLGESRDLLSLAENRAAGDDGPTASGWCRAHPGPRGDDSRPNA
ncbi:hypothetical protein GCM10020254_03400 [Streptomyces goshikiensis]